MAAKPHPKHLQILKYYVDIVASKDEAVVAARLAELDKLTITIDTATWLAALRYAERRIELVQMESNLLLERSGEIAKVMGKYKEDGSGLVLTKGGYLREKQSLGLAGDAEVEEVIALTTKAVAAFCRVKEERGVYERRLARDLVEVVELEP
ncbi:hypothetical protein LTR36_010732 [Oleoguttula mirabilis]|uniref:Uncharacterized protein n=1 Tax=Oleoguttula mirabilis TaxID=1507867 RepID=A0AAV9JQW8_9PEZI|nr:hypothetical protein LTR36_010732 [Oleoguttula mirabilis]